MTKNPEKKEPSPKETLEEYKVRREREEESNRETQWLRKQYGYKVEEGPFEKEVEEVKEEEGEKDFEKSYAKHYYPEEEEQKAKAEAEAKKVKKELEKVGEEQEKKKQELIEEIDKPLRDLIEKEGEIKDLNEKIEGTKGWLRGGERKELEKSRSKTKEEKEEIDETIGEIENKYITKGLLISEIREIIEKRKKEIKEGKEGKREKKEKEPTGEKTKEGKEEAEKRAEGVEEAVGEAEEEIEENIEGLTKEKKSIFEKLKSPKGRLLLTALIAGATIACPLTSGFGVYGLLHTGLSPMGANLIAGYIGGSEVIRNVRELIKARKQAKAEKE